MTGGIAVGEARAPRRTGWTVVMRLVAALLFLLGCWNLWDGIAALGRGGTVTR